MIQMQSSVKRDFIVINFRYMKKYSGGGGC